MCYMLMCFDQGGPNVYKYLCPVIKGGKTLYSTPIKHLASVRSNSTIELYHHFLLSCQSYVSKYRKKATLVNLFSENRAKYLL